MKTDIEIARETPLKKIKEVATQLGIPREEVQNYGKYMAKIPIHLIDDARVKEHNLILVTAITPNKAGVGKTTVSIGLALALNRLGKKAVVALREPSLGPCFGMKGGAAGGGYSQVLPMENINLHFTGDFHAVTSAHNMITALLDNYIYQNRNSCIGLKEIKWKRVLDVNDRSLRPEAPHREYSVRLHLREQAFHGARSGCGWSYYCLAERCLTAEPGADDREHGGFCSRRSFCQHRSWL